MPTFNNMSPNPRCEQNTTSFALWFDTEFINCFSASDTVQFSMGEMICLFMQFITGKMRVSFLMERTWSNWFIMCGVLN